MTSERLRTEGEAFLHDWHGRHAGATSFCFADGRVEGEQGSTYDLLAELVPARGTPLCVLDLGCGDGLLLERVLARRRDETRAIGVDMSTDELALARGRPGLTAELFCERAQALPLPEGSVDFVLSHMAFMLMDELEQVIAELRRVLRPGGTFSAIVSAQGTPREALYVFIEVHRRVQARCGGQPLPPLGDRRTSMAEGLRSLVGSASGFADPISLRDVSVRLDATPERVFEILALMYPFDLLTAEGKRALEQEFLDEVRARASADGRVGCSFGLRQVTCVRTR